MGVEKCNGRCLLTHWQLLTGGFILYLRYRLACLELVDHNKRVPALADCFFESMAAFVEMRKKGII